jgi:disulfide bond formation protein DsbB
MTGRRLGLIAALGSLGMMIAALGFQYIGELPPCKMCYWQRYPHIAAIGIGVLFLFFAYRGLLLLGALSALTTGVIGVYHVGVEQKWWQGPDTCTSSSTDGLSVDQLLDQIMTAPLVRCDDCVVANGDIHGGLERHRVICTGVPVGDSVQKL